MGSTQSIAKVWRTVWQFGMLVVEKEDEKPNAVDQQIGCLGEITTEGRGLAHLFHEWENAVV